MLTYTTSLQSYLNLTDDSDTNQDIGTQRLNESNRAVASIRSGRWRWLETTETIQTVANQQSYSIPNNIRHAVDIYVETSPGDNQGTIWFPEIVYDPVIWKKVLSAKLGYGDIPRFVYIQNDTMYFSPIPTTNNNKIYVRGRLNLTDLNIADYTTGTIVSVPFTTTTTGAIAENATSATLSSNWTLSTGAYTIIFSNGEYRKATLTNGSAAFSWTTGLESPATTAITIAAENGGSIITGSATAWTSGMAGRYIQITNTSAANGGDGFWYKIARVESATVLVLQKAYQGTAISAGSATYTIGQVSPIPEAYQIAPVYRSAAQYWQNKGDSNKAQMYWRMYDGGVEAGLSREYGGILSQMMEAEGSTVEGAYISPTDFYGRINPNNPEPDVATSSFL